MEKQVKIKSNGIPATGRRKTSIARVRLIAGGTGKITINCKDIEQYFVSGTLKLIVRQPLALVEGEKFDFIVNVKGGGLTGQAGAIRHGIARAIIKHNEAYKGELKKAGFVTRDPRTKERKKFGLVKARKAPPYGKGGQK
ncbi:MAG: 30S ribosomal protein S9 [Firmicutes bacterium]|nr:30S ribosomal protein S9 [Bacillota bacterium]